jgi:hypothetical protein
MNKLGRVVGRPEILSVESRGRGKTSLIVRCGLRDNNKRFLDCARNDRKV